MRVFSYRLTVSARSVNRKICIFAQNQFAFLQVLFIIDLRRTPRIIEGTESDHDNRTKDQAGAQAKRTFGGKHRAEYRRFRRDDLSLRKRRDRKSARPCAVRPGARSWHDQRTPSGRGGGNIRRLFRTRHFSPAGHAPRAAHRHDRLRRTDPRRGKPRRFRSHPFVYPLRLYAHLPRRFDDRRGAFTTATSSASASSRLSKTAKLPPF